MNAALRITQSVEGGGGDGVLSAHFLDVGQGDCTILVFPDGKTMLIDMGDSGNMNTVDGGKKSIKDKIIGYIDDNIAGGDQNFIFDYAMVTHTDADHCGNTVAVLQKYPAKIIYRPNVIATNKGFIDPALAITADPEKDSNEKFWTLEAGLSAEAIISKIASKDTVTYKNAVEQMYKEFTREGVKYTPKVIVSDGRVGKQDFNGADSDGIKYYVNFYGPLSPRYLRGSTDEWNNCSNIMEVRYRDKKLFLMGDAEKEATEEFVIAYKDIVFDFDAIKLGHHGSRTSSSKEFLEMLASPAKRPSVMMVISCGIGNSYGHPHAETLGNLNDLGYDTAKNLQRTDLNGDIGFSIKDSGLTDGAEGLRLKVGGWGVEELEWVEWWQLAVILWIGSLVVVFTVIKTKKA